VDAAQAPLRRVTWTLVMLVTTLGIALRVVPWLANYPLHRDEALYGYWARLIASGQDPLLLTPWIDKPPFVIYLLAGSLKVFGVSELALRLPGMLAGVLLIPATWGLAQTVSSGPTALLAAILVALCPFAVLFSPTAFTDPWLTLWLVISAWTAVSGRPLSVGREPALRSPRPEGVGSLSKGLPTEASAGDQPAKASNPARRAIFRAGPFWAGLTLGLAVASKQQGVLAAPFVVGLLLSSGRITDARNSKARYSKLQVHRRARFSAICNLLFATILGFAVIFAPLIYWDSLRWHNRPSFWDRSITTYGGIGLAPLAEWSKRAGAWAEQLGYLFGFPLLSALILGLAAWAGIRGPKMRNAEYGMRNGTSYSAFCILTSVFVIGYVLLHFVLSFQPWDRYLVPLVPFVSVLAARGLAVIFGIADAHATAGATADEDAAGCHPRIAHECTNNRRHSWIRGDIRGWPVGIFRTAPWARAIAAGALALSLAYAAWLGAAGRLPVGSDHSAYAGIRQVAETMRAQPRQTIIYHHSLGWYFDFYLYDAPQERRWFDTTIKLAADADVSAQAEPDRPLWLVIPAWEAATADEARPLLASHGLTLSEAGQVSRPDGSPSFMLYRILRTEAPNGN
jgi:hypothetical protein